MSDLPRLPPELLELVMEDQPQGTLASCTRVSQTWSDVGIRILWRHLASPLPLLELLAPLHPTISGPDPSAPSTWTFKPSELAAADWRRFDQYASRVLTLEYYDLEDIKGPQNKYIDASAFLMIQCYRSHSGSLLPNLASLSWTFRRPWNVQVAPSIIPFLSPTITSLQITVATAYPKDRPEQIATIWSTLMGRTPNVTSVRIMINPDDTGPWDDIGSRWLASCERLESITLPRFWHSASIVEALESSPVLRIIRAERSGDYFHWLSPIRVSFLPHWLQDGAFPNLTFASFDAPLSDLLQALQSTTKFGCLSGISYGTEVGPLTLLPEALSLLAVQCTHLESIVLDFTSRGGDDWMNTVQFEALHPLLSCRSLSHVEIRHDRPIEPLESDIEDMGKSWPKLTYLLLEALWGTHDEDDPGYEEDVSLGIPIDLLAAFPTNLPRLEYLGLHFNPNLPPTSDLYPSTSFSYLFTLSVGTSEVYGSVTDIAAFLARLCPPDLQIVCNEHRLEPEDIQAWSQVEEELRSKVSSVGLPP